MTLLNEEEGKELQAKLLDAVNDVLSAEREPLEVVYAIAVDNTDTGDIEFYTGGCLPNTKEVRQELLARAIERVQ